MIKRSTTFPFAAYVSGRYVWTKDMKTDEVTLTRLFSLMTSEEKKIIWTLDFDAMWFKYWMTKPESMAVRIEHRVSFASNKALFNERFTHDGGRWLQKMLNSTTSVSAMTLYEFPRGRIEKETSLEAAKREFTEETHIKVFEVINPEAPIKFDLKAKDCDKTYNYDYYVARVTKQNKNVRLEDYNQRQEIDEIVFLPLAVVLNLGAEQSSLALAAMRLI